MSDVVLVAVISLIGVIISGVISAVVASNLIKYRIDQLEKKVDSHNSYAEKFSQASQDIALIKTEISWIKSTMERKG